jgi:succinate dehydrogenase/fumarate reductase cytochrome b subunit
MRFEYTGLIGLLILVADIWAIISIVGSNRTTGSKVLWTLLIIFLPVLGWLIWLVAGPRAGKA